ncbi:RNA polymerase sigma factor [Steroidobacter sp.]|uniref:RNA polymerase sigma factor n=1 Tax=Steroidobacter sp. TaxID=1978227 RepID=UPI001A3B8CCC|nr:RNA polymerase sigma factor [Steroidobacter sp.]MBL8265451.1 RNA polymerase sigma factor [Steroidobacter sp.]
MTSDANSPRARAEMALVWDRDQAKADFVSQLARSHQTSLQRFIFAKVRCEETASELAQESFLKLLSMPAPQRLEHPRAYLFQIANNLALDRVRRDRLKVIDPAAVLQEQDCESPAPSQEEELNYRQLYGAFMAAYDALPVKCREVFYLRRYENLAVSQIASRLHISTRMVHKHLAHAMACLKSKLLAPIED